MVIAIHLWTVEMSEVVPLKELMETCELWKG